MPNKITKRILKLRYWITFAGLLSFKGTLANISVIPGIISKHKASQGITDPKRGITSNKGTCKYMMFCLYKMETKWADQNPMISKISLWWPVLYTKELKSWLNTFSLQDFSPPSHFSLSLWKKSTEQDLNS